MKKIKKQYDFAATTFRSDLGKGIFPKPFEQFCTENVIVMDFVDGIPLSRKKELIANKDYDVEKSVKSYVNAAVRNWFRDDQQTYFYQADPHLSNILALPHGDAASIDYGLISELSQKEATICKDLIIAVYLKDVPQTIKIVAQMVSKDYGECYKLLRPDIENYLEEAARQGFGFWFLGLAKVLIQNDVKFPLFLTTFGRTAVVLDGLVYSYLPNETTVDILGEEFNKQVFNQAIKNIKDINWLKLCFTLSKKIKETPDLINIALEDPLKMISEIAKVIKTTA